MIPFTLMEILLLTFKSVAHWVSPTDALSLRICSAWKDKLQLNFQSSEQKDWFLSWKQIATSISQEKNRHFSCVSLDQKVSLVKTHGSKLALKALVVTSPGIALCFPTAS